jgi:heme A synthase
MRSTYRVLALLICLGVVLQAAAIAFGWFDVIADSEDADVVLNDDYDGNAGHMMHGIIGMSVIPLLGLILLVVSFLTKVPGASKWAGYVFGSIVFQVVIGIMSFSIPILGVLHGVNAFVMFGLALMAARRMEAVTPAEAGRENAYT